MLDFKNIHHVTKVNAAIMQAIPDGILVLDQDLTIRHHNAHALNLFEIKNDALVGLTATQAIPELTDFLKKITSSRSNHRPTNLKKVSAYLH
jgi:sensor histidine kinase regulating citrate/malate metabolism